MYFVYLKNFQEMPKADCAVLPKYSGEFRGASAPLIFRLAR